MTTGGACVDLSALLDRLTADARVLGVVRLPVRDGDGRTRVLVTTTPTMENHRIERYLGPVFGETVLGTSILRDMFASITDLTGGRSSAYETVLNQGRTIAVREMAERVEQAGGNDETDAVGDSILPRG